MLVETNAIVLKRIPYSDTSLICRLFTKEMGKVTILAKGANRQKRSISALLEPINHIHIQYFQKNSRDIQILKEAEFIQYFSNVHLLIDPSSRVVVLFKFIHNTVFKLLHLFF